MEPLRIQIEIDPEITPDLYAVLAPLKRVKRTEKLRALAAESLALRKLQQLASQGLIPVQISGLQEGIGHGGVSQHLGSPAGVGEWIQTERTAPAVNTAPSKPTQADPAPPPPQQRPGSRGRAVAATMSQSLLRG